MRGGPRTSVPSSNPGRARPSHNRDPRGRRGRRRESRVGQYNCTGRFTDRSNRYAGHTGMSCQRTWCRRRCAVSLRRQMGSATNTETTRTETTRTEATRKTVVETSRPRPESAMQRDDRGRWHLSLGRPARTTRRPKWTEYWTAPETMRTFRCRRRALDRATIRRLRRVSANTRFVTVTTIMRVDRHLRA